MILKHLNRFYLKIILSVGGVSLAVILLNYLGIFTNIFIHSIILIILTFTAYLFLFYKPLVSKNLESYLIFQNVQFCTNIINEQKEINYNIIELFYTRFTIGIQIYNPEEDSYITITHVPIFIKELCLKYIVETLHQINFFISLHYKLETEIEINLNKK